jgi:hypothetical protein
MTNSKFLAQFLFYMLLQSVERFGEGGGEEESRGGKEEERRRGRVEMRRKEETRDAGSLYVLLSRV